MPLSPKPSIQFQERDLELLRGLLGCRVMTLSHASDIFFAGAREAAKKRIAKLKAAGLLGERSRKPYEPAIIYLLRQGHSLLQERGMLNGFPAIGWPALERRIQVSDLTLRHELEVMDVRAAFHAAVRTHVTISISEFTTWPLMCEFMASRGHGPERLVKPDAFIRIEEHDAGALFEHIFFLELDRGTETLNKLVDKALCYLDYYQHGGLAVRFGRAAAEYKEFPFRALMVLQSVERRNNLAEALLTNSPPIYTHTWLSTFDEVTADPFGPIWVRPRDYGKAVEGTPHAARKRYPRSFYRRQAEREQFVEARIAKHRLFESEDRTT